MGEEWKLIMKIKGEKVKKILWLNEKGIKQRERGSVWADLLVSRRYLAKDQTLFNRLPWGTWTNTHKHTQTELHAAGQIPFSNLTFSMRKKQCSTKQKLVVWNNFKSNIHCIITVSPENKKKTFTTSISNSCLLQWLEYEYDPNSSPKTNGYSFITK